MAPVLIYTGAKFMTQAVKARRARRSEGEWQRLLARQRTSGLSIKAFCRREQVGEASFHHWRRTLAEQREGGIEGHQDTGSSFVDMGVLGAVPAGKPSLELKLDLGDGLVLHLVRG